MGESGFALSKLSKPYRILRAPVLSIPYSAHVINRAMRLAFFGVSLTSA
jgi:hypothetical protein